MHIELNHSLVGQILDGDYVIQEYLGSGGMGATFRAKHVSLAREVCIKFMGLTSLTSQESLLRFKREAKVLARLRHRNIVECYAFGILEKTYPYLVMEMVQGRSLRSLLQDGALDWQRACSIVIQICDGMQEAHVSGVCHRDLKPENIMLSTQAGQERVKIIDFGLAGKISPAVLETITTPGSLIGTVPYMAPEAFAGKQDGRSGDIYALGCILYECLTTKIPFEADNPVASIQKKTKQVLPPLDKAIQPDHVRLELNEIIGAATALHSSNRPKDCSELARAVNTLLSDSAPVRLVPPATRQPGRAGGGNPIVLLILVLVLSAFGVKLHRSSSLPAEPIASILPARSNATTTAIPSTQIASFTARANHLNAIANTPAFPPSLSAYASELKLLLQHFGSRFESSQAGNKRLLRDLCDSTGDLLLLASQSSNEKALSDLRGTFVDLLASCGYYQAARHVLTEPTLTTKPRTDETPTEGNLSALIECIRNKIQTTEEDEYFVERMRALAPRFTTQARRLLFLELVTLMTANGMNDEWSPSLFDVTRKMNAGTDDCSLAQLLPNTRKTAFYRVPRISRRELLPPAAVAYVAALIYQEGDTAMARKIFADAARQAVRKNQGIRWCLLRATLACTLAQDKKLAESQTVLEEIFQSSYWKRRRQDCGESTAVQAEAAATINGIVQTLCAECMSLNNQPRAVEEKLKAAGDLLLRESTWAPVAPFSFMLYLNHADYWNFRNATSRTVALQGARVVESTRRESWAQSANIYLDLTALLLLNGQTAEARAAWKKAVRATKCYFSEVRYGGRTELLAGVLSRVAYLKNSMLKAEVEQLSQELDELPKQPQTN